MGTSRQVSDVILSKSESFGRDPAAAVKYRGEAIDCGIVEETLVEGAPVARVARAHGINANQVVGWRRFYRAGRLGERKPTMKLLRVRVRDSVPPPPTVERMSAAFQKPQPGAIHIELRQAQVRWT